MSFSATPLGQGRRLDQHTFLNKPHPPHRPPSPRTIPTSYAYGYVLFHLFSNLPVPSINLFDSAPTLGPRSQTNQSSHTRDGDNPSLDHESALTRFARLKSRDQQADITNRPGGPKIISSPPQPEKWSVKDTSVNIATAFHQAVSTSHDMNPNDSWASSSRAPPAVPRSTSVEYEQQTQSASNRRLAAPPNRLPVSRTYAGSRKPLSKTVSVRHVPDSEGEEEPHHQNGREKSPFDQMVDITKRALAPATFYLRQRSQEPDPRATTNGKDSSYDYSAEEREFASAQRSAASRRTTAAHKRNRISTDNKAYRPTASDLEDDDDDDIDDGKKGKKRKKKKDFTGGPLTTLPVAGYDKRKKKKSRGSKGNTADVNDDAGSGSDDHASDQVSDTIY